MEYQAAHQGYVEACSKVDKHLETCAYCDDFRGENKCEEVERLLDLVGEALGRINGYQLMDWSRMSLEQKSDKLATQPIADGAHVVEGAYKTRDYFQPSPLVVPEMKSPTYIVKPEALNKTLAEMVGKEKQPLTLVKLRRAMWHYLVDNNLIEKQ